MMQASTFTPPLRRAIAAAERSFVLRGLLLFFALIHVVFQLFLWTPAVFRRQANGGDVDVYFRAARRFLRHQPLYDLRPHHSPIFDYLYAPQFAVVLTPFVRLGQHNFATVQYCLILASFWVFAYLLAKISLPKPTMNAVLIWGLVLAVSPRVYFCMALGQVQPLLWVAFALAIISDRWRGVLLGLTLQVKTYTLIPLACAVWRERRAVAAPAAIVIALGAAVGTIACGAHVFLQWREAMGYVLSHSALLRPDNISLPVLALKGGMASGWRPATTLPAAVCAYLTLMSVAGPLLVWRICRRQPAQKLYAWVGLASMAFSPICWAFYLTAGYVLAALYIRDYIETAEDARAPAEMAAQRKTELAPSDVSH